MIQIMRKALGYTLLVGPSTGVLHVFLDGEERVAMLSPRSPTLVECDNFRDIDAVLIEYPDTGLVEAYVLDREIPEKFKDIVEVGVYYRNDNESDLRAVREGWASAPWAPVFLEPKVVRFEQDECRD